MATNQVLLIEDDPRDARMVEIAFSEESTRPPALHRAQDLAEGLERLAKGGIDAVLLDLTLPDAEGLEGLQRVLEASPDVPVVVLTGLAKEGTGERAVRAGAQDFLVKGSLFTKLLDRSVRYAIERHRILTALRQEAD